MPERRVGVHEDEEGLLATGLHLDRDLVRDDALAAASDENSRAPNGAAAFDELNSLEARWTFPAR
jgi:hypothetical protein